MNKRIAAMMLALLAIALCVTAIRQSLRSGVECDGDAAHWRNARERVELERDAERWDREDQQLATTR